MWHEYVPIQKKRLQAKKKMEKLRKNGKRIEPVSIEGRAIAKQFWGKKWCEHIENFADHDNRLPRGRTYVRNGSVCHLEIMKGKVEAIVSGSIMYNVSVQIKTLNKEKWQAIKTQCAGMIGTLLELLNGKIAKNVMEVVVNANHGLFPFENEISYGCSCPDWTGMCKHVAAVLYGIGNRLDQCPELLFCLRGVDPQDLTSQPMSFSHLQEKSILRNENLSDLFGIELEISSQQSVEPLIKNSKKNAPQVKKQKNKLDVGAVTGNSIKSLRIKKGLSISTFANVLGVSPASIYRWEGIKGTIKLHNSTKEALKKAWC